MKTFIITVVDRLTRKRHRYVSIAKNWHEALTVAFNEYGINCVVSVRPAK